MVKVTYTQRYRGLGKVRLSQTGPLGHERLGSPLGIQVQGELSPYADHR